ncbi:MAG: hypothetical protein KDJ86_16150 [Bauldia sp.]|uniref:hypothetical protein n=1 Tax=Bauldia sp. TaxID=2575872 RepID=UPI001D4BEB80|nr:hypothetical protein [Bauldia sp.]MCB1497315.1 hypothetical protein [Bauldia sp.]
MAAGLEGLLGIPASDLAYAASAASVVGAGATVVGFFAERDENRRIIDALAEIKGYLVRIEQEIRQIQRQNEAILRKLDELPDQIEEIVTEVVEVALLEERYATLTSILSNYFNLGEAERRRYRINSAGWDRVSEALTYLVLHENRISRLLDLIFWCEFALVASEYRGAPVIKSLITGKHGMIIPLFLEVKERLEDSHKDLLKLLESRFVRRHNLSDDLADLDQLTFRLEDDKAETMLRVVIACPPGRIPNGCPEHVVYEPIPANIEFNRRKRKVPARIEAQKRIVARRRDEYAAVRDALLMLLRYLEIVTEDEETLAEHPLSTAVEEGFVIPTDSVAFVPMAATP